jgi:hypothetical protein
MCAPRFTTSRCLAFGSLATALVHSAFSKRPFHYYQDIKMPSLPAGNEVPGRIPDSPGD